MTRHTVGQTAFGAVTVVLAFFTLEIGRLLVLPVPYCSQELHHIDSLRPHLDHPGMLVHPPGCGAAAAFFLETVSNVSTGRQVNKPVSASTYQHSMKYLKLSLHFSLFSGSSLSFGMGCRTI